jgi:hypothetical protein
MSLKFDRSRYGPGWLEVFLGTLLSAVLGVVLAAAYFVFKPVATVRELPKEPLPGVVYYIEGSRDDSRARRLPAKEKFFLKGGSVVVNEDELNTAANPLADLSQAAKAASANAPAATTPLLASAAPNFRIHDGSMQITVPVRLRMEVASLDLTIYVQATGHFVRRVDTFVFVPSTMYVGSCPIERMPAVMSLLEDKLLRAQPIPADIMAAWSRLADVMIDGSNLRLTMP